jgi:hypothetical protein
MERSQSPPKLDLLKGDLLQNFESPAFEVFCHALVRFYESGTSRAYDFVLRIACHVKCSLTLSALWTGEHVVIEVMFDSSV